MRAVENPISAIFDLAEEVNEQAPTLRKLIGYSRFFIAAWLFVDFLLILVISPQQAAVRLPLMGVLFLAAVSLRWAPGRVSRGFLLGVIVVDGLVLALTFGMNFFLGGLLATLFVLGIVILSLMKDVREFFRYYVLRHRAIQSVREEDPVVYVPQGEDAVERLLQYFRGRHPEIRDQAQKGTVQAPAVLRGRSGLLYQFDAVVRGAPSPLWRPFGLGESGYAIYVKAFDGSPSVKDLDALKEAVEDVSKAEKVPPTRVIALWTPAEEEALSDEAYDFLTSQVVTYRRGGQEYRCSLELIMEAPDGTYDFIPHVTDALYA